MRFVIEGKIHPYVHRTYRGKHTAKAKAYHASQNAIRWQLANLMQRAGMHKIQRGIPLRISITAIVPKGLHTFDCTNLQKALEDAAQTIVFDNDCWVDQICTFRQLGNTYMTIMDIEPL